MKAFGLELPPALLDRIAAHAEREYPSEACGLGFGPPDAETLAELVPMENVQDRYHALDPEQFTRTSKDAFRLDDAKRLKLLRANEPKGWTERLLYHSHPDAGAYFSPEDRANAVLEGMELMPGAVHLVVSVVDGRRRDMAAFKYDEARARFDEHRIGAGWLSEPPPVGWPDLKARAMEGREASRPIRPVGGALVPRKVTASEKATLQARTEGRRLTIDDRARAWVSAFGAGLCSPLSGFMTAVEIEASKAGTLQMGALSWRSAVTLEVDAVPDDLTPGTAVELVASGGEGVAVMDVTEVRPGDRVGLAGSIYVYPEAVRGDAAERRAELLRRGARRILAVSSNVDDAAFPGFDVVLWTGPQDGLPDEIRDEWLFAAMAQSAGATHVVVRDPKMVEVVRATLAIEPVAST